MRRRPIKVRGGSLGWFLVWAVVFADIGTSIYYVPGILYHQVQKEAAIFVSMTAIVFVLLAIKYAEVAWRYPEGGGVVTVASRAIHPFAGLVGGLFILVDYYLTAAISAVSGFQYLSVVAPSLRQVVVVITVAALLGLGFLNFVGIRESARVSAGIAVAAAIGQLLTVLAVAVSLGPAGIVHSFQQLAAGPRLEPLRLLTGYAAAFLAFSGLESIAQIAPAMREVRKHVAYWGMGAVIITLVVTSPLLTLWSTTLLQVSPDNDTQLISVLGAHIGGPVLGAFVAVTGSLLLVFASNTAIIGAYHVFIALSRMGFQPRFLEKLNSWRKTPLYAIGFATLVPVAVVVLANGNLDLLGDLYAFGLLGAFSVTCIGLDVVRWHERDRWRGRAAGVIFGLGVMTTLLVVIAWTTNLVAKPLATAFGGGLTVAGLAVAALSYNLRRRRRPVVFPFLHRAGRDVVPLSRGQRLRPAPVLAILPDEREAADAVVAATVRACAGRPVVFLYRSGRRYAAEAQLMEVADPYLRDRDAQDAFAHAEVKARRFIPDRRYVYIPGDLPRQAIADAWRQIHPTETVVAEGDQDVLPPLAVDRVRRSYPDRFPVLHLISHRQPTTVPA